MEEGGGDSINSNRVYGMVVGEVAAGAGVRSRFEKMSVAITLAEMISVKRRSMPMMRGLRRGDLSGGGVGIYLVSGQG